MGRSVGLLGIVFVLMLSAGLWLAQSHGNPARSVEDAAFCAHVADLGLMVAVSAALYLVFKRRGWI